MYLQLTEEIVKHVKGNDDWGAIITKGLKSSLKRLSHIKGKKKGLLGKERTFCLELDERLLGLRERELLDPEVKGNH